MPSQNLTEKAVKAAGKSLSEVARQFGFKSTQSVANWVINNQVHLAHSVARASGGVFVPLADMEEVDNADINQRLLEAIEQITRYSQQIRVAIEDGVIEPHEKAVIDEELYQAIANCNSIRHWYTEFFACQKRVTPASVQLRAPWRQILWRKPTHEQFNGK